MIRAIRRAGIFALCYVGAFFVIGVAVQTYLMWPY